jgi:iron complex outermembrane receptor protein
MVENGWAVCVGMLLGALGCLGDGVVELPAYRVDGWHFDWLGVGSGADVVRLGEPEIEAAMAGGVPELLARLGGVRFHGFTAGGSEGQVALRGFGEGSGLRALVLVDGVVYNPPDMGGINWQGVEVAELEQVEIIRGGQGVLYGNHAVSGVVKLQTRRPQGGLGGRLQVESGSWGHDRVVVSLEGGAGRFGMRGGGQLVESRGYREHSASRGRTGYVTWIWDEAESAAGEWRGRLQVEDSETAFPGPLTWQQMRADPRQSVSSGMDRAQADLRTLSLSGRGEGDWGGWELQGGALERERRWQLDGRSMDNAHWRWMLTPRIRIRLGDAFVIGGIDTSQDFLDTRDYLSRDEGIIRAVADIERLSLGGYLFGGLTLGEGWTLSGGVRREAARTDNRYVHYREEQLRPLLETNRGTVPNPDYRDPPEADPRLSYAGEVRKRGWAAELTLVRQLAHGTSIWLGWDRVYRYPALDETASYQGYPLADPLNTNLLPETGHNFEAGLKRMGTNWHWGMTLWWMRLDDEIAYDERALLNRNIGATGRRGAELSFGYQSGRYGFSGRLAGTRAEYRSGALAQSGARLPLAPEWEANLSGWWRPAAQLRMGGHAIAYSDQVQGNDYQSERRRIAGYALFGVFLSWEPRNGMTASIAVDNLLDREHAVTAYNGGFYPGAGRRVTLRLGGEF